MKERRGTEQAGEQREIICGRQPVKEMFAAGRRKVHSIYVSDRGRGGALAEIEARAKEAGAKVRHVDPVTLDRLAGSAHHQGVAAEVSSLPVLPLAALEELGRAGGEPLLLVLDHLQDPQNLGSLLRTAETAGVSAVVLPRRRACGVTPAAVRASAGAAEHVPVAEVANIAEVIRRLRETGMRFAALDCGPGAEIYTEAALTGPLGIVVGSEGDGLQPLVRDLCDVRVRIPQSGRLDSLNAAVAGAVVLFEALRQRRRPA